MKKGRNNYIKPDIQVLYVEPLKFIASSGKHSEKLNDEPQDDIIVGARQHHSVYDDFEDEEEDY